jgi:hypothetical protein
MVAAVAAAGEPIALGLALEIRARHIIKQQLIVEIEQRSQALLEVGLQGLLVRQQTVERAVQPVIVDALGRRPQKIVQDARLEKPLGAEVDIDAIETHLDAHDHRTEDRVPRILSPVVQSLGGFGWSIVRPLLRRRVTTMSRQRFDHGDWIGEERSQTPTEADVRHCSVRPFPASHLATCS